MRRVKIGVGCVSPTVGALGENRALLEALIQEARRQQVHLLVTPELGISGYSLGDRVLWDDFPERCFGEVERLAERCEDIDVLVGTPVREEGWLYNGLVLCSGGRPVGVTLKQRLPNYGVFYEARQWTAWPGGTTTVRGLPAGELIYELPYGRVAAEICEDLWAVDAPSRKLARHGAEILANGAASPFVAGMQARRRHLLLGNQEATLAVYAYANLLGCDSSRLVFEGCGMIAAPAGQFREAPRLSPQPWTLTTAVVDLDDVTSLRTANNTWRSASLHTDPDPPARVTLERRFVPPPLSEPGPESAAGPAVGPGADVGPEPDAGPEPEALPLTAPSFFLPARRASPDVEQSILDDILDALALGVRDYYRRAGAFERMLVALSGGRDSALTLIAAWRAASLLPDPPPAPVVHARYLPTEQYSSSATREAALGLARELDVPVEVVGIQKEFDLAQHVLGQMVGDDQAVVPVALENAQARIRGSMMLNWANCVKGLVLVTSNMSEFAVGYFTTGGDNQGGFAPISGIPKTLVNRLLERAADRWGLASLDPILALPPSAELAANQADEAELMPYDVLDDILFLYAQRRRAPVDVWHLLRARHPLQVPEQLRAWVKRFVRLFAANQWKRDQSPVGLKMLALDLDPKSGFRFPVIQSMQEDLALLDAAQ